MESSEKKKQASLSKISLVFIFVGLIAVSSHLWLKSKRLSSNPQLSGTPSLEEQDSLINWKEYVNEEYKFSVMYPELLFKDEKKEEGGYLFFVRFEENQFSQGKGLAIGVRETSFEEEVERIKMDFEGELVSKLLNESEVLVSGKKGLRLDYEPWATGDVENRSIVIVENGGYAYSISTVPEQIEKIITSFRLW